MNRKQKIVLWLGIIIFVFIGLFPPTYMVGGALQPYGKQDKLGSRSFRQVGGTREVALGQLCRYWGITSILTAGLIYTFKDKKDKKTKAEQKQ